MINHKAKYRLFSKNGSAVLDTIRVGDWDDDETFSILSNPDGTFTVAWMYSQFTGVAEQEKTGFKSRTDCIKWIKENA